MLRAPKNHERAYLLKQAASTEPWKEGEAEELLGGILEQYFSGQLPENHSVAVWDVETENHGVVGWSYFAPNMYADGVWDVWWIGVAIQMHGKGYGTQLLTAIESEISGKGGRIVVIETSSADNLQKARRFYPKLGYAECGTIPHFYGKDEHKVIYSKQL